MTHPGYIDFHCHLDDPCYEGRRWQVIDQCFAAGFSRLVTVVDPYSETSLQHSAEILAYNGRIDFTLGAHPHQADQYSAEIEKRMSGFLGRHEALAIGEVGLDFHYGFSTRENQSGAFRRQIAFARERSLPLVIHSRQAESEVLKILSQEKFAGPVVFHCYTGDGKAADEIFARGYSLSFSGIITFKKAKGLREIVAGAPLDRLFSETDSPYLAPEPERGRINTPLAATRVAEKIAAIKGIDLSVLLDQIERNYQRLKR